MKKIYISILSLAAFQLGFSQYCQPTFQYNADGNMITRVTIGAIDKVSPFTSGTTPSYEDFTSLSTDVYAGYSHPISIKAPSSTFESDIMVYIDFNQNGNFDDADESFYLGRVAAANPANAHTISGDILIPSNALPGITRMRILKNSNVASYSNPDAPNSITGACASLRAGQAEDYSVNIIVVNNTCNNEDPSSIAGSVGCVSLTYNGAETQYTTVRAADGNIWLLQNLGSSKVAEASDDTEAYGDLFQWGRWADGHQLRTSISSTTPPSPNNPSGLGNGSDLFYTAASGSGWWNPANADDEWTAETPSGATAGKGCDPCKALGNGWAMPTEQDWEKIIETENITNVASAYASNLKLAVAGSRSGDNFNFTGVRGYYWSSTVSASNTTYSKHLYYSNAIVNPNAGGFRDMGAAVRCIKKSTLNSPDFTALNYVLYPNPVSDVLTIQSSDKIQTITLYNQLGQMVISTTGYQVNLSHIDRGVYIVKIMFENGKSASKKIVKK